MFNLKLSLIALGLIGLASCGESPKSEQSAIVATTPSIAPSPTPVSASSPSPSPVWLTPGKPALSLRVDPGETLLLRTRLVKGKSMIFDPGNKDVSFMVSDGSNEVIRDLAGGKLGKHEGIAIFRAEAGGDYNIWVTAKQKTFILPTIKDMQ